MSKTEHKILTGKCQRERQFAMWCC